MWRLQPKLSFGSLVTWHLLLFWINVNQLLVLVVDCRLVFLLLLVSYEGETAVQAVVWGVSEPSQSEPGSLPPCLAVCLRTPSSSGLVVDPVKLRPFCHLYSNLAFLYLYSCSYPLYLSSRSPPPPFHLLVIDPATFHRLHLAKFWSLLWQSVDTFIR